MNMTSTLEIKTHNAKLKKGALAIDKNNNQPVIVVDSLILSPIRLVKRMGNVTTSVYSRDLEEVNLESWEKAVIVKLRDPK